MISYENLIKSKKTEALELLRDARDVLKSFGGFREEIIFLDEASYMNDVEVYLEEHLSADDVANTTIAAYFSNAVSKINACETFGKLGICVDSYTNMEESKLFISTKYGTIPFVKFGDLWDTAYVNVVEKPDCLKNISKAQREELMRD